MTCGAAWFLELMWFHLHASWSGVTCLDQIVVIWSVHTLSVCDRSKVDCFRHVKMFTMTVAVHGEKRSMEKACVTTIICILNFSGMYLTQHLPHNVTWAVFDKGAWFQLPFIICARSGNRVKGIGKRLYDDRSDVITTSSNESLFNANSFVS